MFQRENKKACVSLDISKGSSHVQAFYSVGQKANDVCIIKHTKSGFQQLSTIIDTLENSMGEKCVVVFESTGVYSKPVENYLQKVGKKYYLIPPLLSAKVRKSDIRPTKTDSKDCETIANVYYLKKLKATKPYEKIHEKLKGYCSYYLFLSNRTICMKTKYRHFLDNVYPRIDDYFNVYSPYFMELILKSPNPHKTMKKTDEYLYKLLTSYAYCGNSKAMAFIHSFHRYFDDAAIDINEDDSAIDILVSTTAKLKEDMKSLENLLNEIILLGMKTEEYKYLITIPGMSKNTAARIAAEISGIDRFPSPSQLVAFAGIDPTVKSSGQMTGNHLPITHKGNQRLRCLLYLVASGTSKSKSEGNPVRDFIIKKKSDGLPPKAAIIAGCNKLARIIYAVCSKREPFSLQNQ
jgi:transposase